MANYNLARYNLSKYNRTLDVPVIYDRIQMGAQFFAQVGLGQRTLDDLRLDASVTGQMVMASGTLDSLSASAEITSEILRNYIAYGNDRIGAEINSDAEMSNLVMSEDTLASVVNGEVYLSPVVRDSVQADAEITCESYLGNKVVEPMQTIAYGIFGASVTAESIEEFIMDLDITIPAGGVLVIDSDNFRVLLNNQNAIKSHSGDWIDKLNRRTKNITILAGGRNLDADIYYQELWL